MDNNKNQYPNIDKSPDNSPAEPEVILTGMPQRDLRSILSGLTSRRNFRYSKDSYVWWRVVTGNIGHIARPLKDPSIDAGLSPLYSECRYIFGRRKFNG